MDIFVELYYFIVRRINRETAQMTKCTSANERFCEMAALTPQTILWEIERLSPAGKLVEAATSQSRQPLAASTTDSAYIEKSASKI